MILSTQKKFIFIHNYKTAGTSMERVLAPYGHLQSTSFYRRLRTGLDNRKILPSWRHRFYTRMIKAPDLQCHIPPSVWHDYFSFGFVRNPFDRHVSLYHFSQACADMRSHEVVKAIPTFKAYIQQLLEHPDFQSSRYVYQKDSFFDNEDKQQVNFVGYFENLVEDFSYVQN
ncbi:sulfotransferase family 2 domain-containing protein [Magnetococcus sp. PR-3]|uniref:sulfotransferase family 2 domain-containing protein n=1 Tax=Magnetococcus sp. PR-3 TaxID=3120355 RepID=UPI002FCDFCE9